MVKNPPEMQETWVWSLGWKDLLEKGLATHSSIVWIILWTEEPGELKFMGSQSLPDWATNTHIVTKTGNKVSLRRHCFDKLLQPPYRNMSELSLVRLCDPVDCSPPGSSVHGILQAGILEWVAISFFRGSSRPRDQTQVSRVAGRRFNLWATREVEP